MNENPKIIICDCDHNNVDVKAGTFTAAGQDFKWLHCQTQQEVIDQCQGAVCFLNQYARMDEVIFKAIPTLKLIVRYGVGVDNVNLADATKYGVQVCNVPDYGMNEVADQAMALMLSVVRKTWLLGNRVQAGAWDYAESIPVRRLSTLTVGIMRTRRIGSPICKRLQPAAVKSLPLTRSCLPAQPPLPREHRILQLLGGPVEPIRRGVPALFAQCGQPVHDERKEKDLCSDEGRVLFYQRFPGRSGGRGRAGRGARLR